MLTNTGRPPQLEHGTAESYSAARSFQESRTLRGFVRILECAESLDVRGLGMSSVLGGLNSVQQIALAEKKELPQRCQLHKAGIYAYLKMTYMYL